ncbi:MAG: hypothetical protein ACJAQT_003517 [Akkermansiaceae bacterium]|jgi:hypothetical protein
MKLKILFLTTSILAGSLLGTNAAFIDLGPNVKVVFTQVTVDGNVVTQAVATITETAIDGTITVKKQTEVVVPDGSGGFVKTVTQDETVATLTSGTSYTVTTSSEVLTTPLDDMMVEGTTTTAATTSTDPVVDFDDLDLPPSTEFYPVDDEFVAPGISPA